MPFKPPLRIAQLRASDADLLALLQEVKRYRSFILRTQLSGGFKLPSGVLAPVYDEWFEILSAEPCVAEQEEMVRELLEAPDKLRYGMRPR
ncbi:hypothetical protein [Achromobacter aegrifaciens]|uniref:Uncharacterized protein n=1 Tax=Achromobacter aegrifaciens TaxID=1287736 RepID=A0AAD2J4H9_ACHAE|nr:hypothetical protein [Achromobacter aegrifaciens]CUJ69248.1 Uncharacterised protein [Achromobacter aegrifaciens]